MRNRSFSILKLMNDLDEIISYLGEYFGKNIPQIRQKDQHKELVIPRQFIAAYLRLLIVKPGSGFEDQSLKKIAYQLGNRSHCSVLHSCKVIQDRCDTEAAFKRKWDEFCTYAEKYSFSYEGTQL